MNKKKFRSRRDFLRRSGAATLATIAGPEALPRASASVREQADCGPDSPASRNGFPPYQIRSHPAVEDYATKEAVANGEPVWSFSNLCYIYGASPDLLPGIQMQEANSRPFKKIRLKKSWEIKHNLCGAESEMTCRTAYNDTQPMLPIHLIDGNPGTVWSSWGLLVPDGKPEWIRIDLPMETELASVALVCAQEFRSDVYGKALPKELEIKTSRDAWHWETVYSTQDAPDGPRVEIGFAPRRAKQIWIVGQNFPMRAPIFNGYVFSIGSVEVRDTAGNNLALVSRGASVTTSSVNYLELNDRFTQDALWAPLNFDLGNKWLRIGGDNGSFMWEFVEHVKGRMELDPRADFSITDCVRHGVSMIVNLDFKGNYIYETPPRKTNWPEARFREMNDNYNDPLPAADANPEMYQGYLRYIEYMTRQLKGRIAYFELGNEWNGWFGAEHFVPTFFLPALNLVKKTWPEARVMLGSTAGFDQNAILDCLGRQRQCGVKNGKLVLSEGEMWLGTVAVREGINAADVTVEVDAEGQGTFGILLRYQDHRKYLAALCSVADHTIMFYEADRSWGDRFAEKKIPNLGGRVHMTAAVHGSTATLTVSGNGASVSTTHTIEHLTGAGAVALMHRSGANPVFFDSFLVEDSQGKILSNDDFSGPEGSVPNGWRYDTGGPNPNNPGLAARIDAIGWHPTVEPDAAYFASVREFQKKCRNLGFKGEFFATEIYAGSMYPPGKKSYPMLGSEIQMAKFLLRSLVGHNGLGMAAGPCHPHFTGRVHPQALCQATWGTPTLNPCRPTMAYYMWRNVATVMDGFQPSDFPVNFSNGQSLLHFTFAREGAERMLAVWIDGPSDDAFAEVKTDVTLPALRATRATVTDIMNGAEQELQVNVSATGTCLNGLLVKDYPVFILLSN